MKTSFRASTFFLLAALAPVAGAVADPIPPAEFSFGVSQGNSLLSGCELFSGNGGLCGSESAGPGFAAVSGGIGTQSYLPVTPGGTVLGPGTAVDAMSLWTSGAGVKAAANLIYSFEATGPANVQFIPVDVISKGLAAAAGSGTVLLNLVITDAGTDGNIPKGIADPDPSAPLLDLTAFCSHGVCASDWNNQTLTDLLCVVNGDNYVISITAITSAGKGSGALNDASASLDPVIKLDPPYPTSCQPPADPNAFHIATSPGTSTGTGVPEPSLLSLAGLAGLVFFGAHMLQRRRVVRIRRPARRSQR